MKALILVASLFLMLSSAFAQVAMSPFCYSGTLQIEGETAARPVFLQFNGTSGKYYLVEKFTMGDNSFETSGKLVGNTLQFNSNNDYIPGGNASYNLDISLTFKDKDVSGDYKLYNYANGEGRGGFGQAGVEPTAVGVFKLRMCKVEVIRL